MKTPIWVLQYRDDEKLRSYAEIEQLELQPV